MNDSKATPIEPRWPVIFAILVVFFLLTILPNRVHVFPRWVPYVFTLLIIVPLLALTVSANKTPWLRLERIAIAIFFAINSIWLLLELTVLMHSMVYRSSGVGGLQLLASSVTVWATNVVMFSLVYWRIDRGGPEARASNTKTLPDWLFPQQGIPMEVAGNWRPTYVDYLFIGFATATAFSPTDAMPLSGRAKLLMMLESLISLVTIIAVAARAINILGS
jgi:hypothetical protein